MENLPEIKEPIDITLSQDELFAEVASNANVSEKEVKTVMDTFIQLYLKKLKLI